MNAKSVSVPSVEWTDSTNYSRGRERIQTGWRAEFGKHVSISITNGHICHPGRFVMHCGAVGINTKPLPEGLTPQDAQAMALRIVRRTLREMLAEVGDE